MKNNSVNYIKQGSVAGLDVFDYGDMHSEGMCEPFLTGTRIKVDGNTYVGSQSFYVFPDRTGRYVLDNGMRYDIYTHLFR